MKKMRTTIGLFALAMASLFLLSACGGAASKPAANVSSGSTDASTVSSSEGTGVLRVGMECGYPPFNWTQLDDSNGAVPLADGTFAGGYDVEIAKLVAASLGKELVIVKSNWDGLTPSLTSGKIDLIIAGMSNTKERRESLDFTDNYYTSDLVIVVAANGLFANAKTLADFKGAKLTGQLGTLHYDVIDQIEGVEKQQAMADFPTMIIALSSGIIDGYVSERPGAISAQATNPNLTFITFGEGQGFDYDGTEVSVAIGLRKGETELKDAVNSALAGISTEQREELMENAVKTQPLAV